MRLLNIATAVFDRAIGCLAVMAGALIVCLMVFVSADVVLRYFFNSPIPTLQDIAQQMLLHITFLSATWILKEDGHTKISIVLSHLSPKTQSVLNFATSILGGMICLIFCWYGARVTWVDFQRHALVTTELRIPYAFVFMIAPVGYFLLSIQFMRRGVAFLKGLKSL